MNISVIIPVYNAEKIILKNIQGFLEQTDNDFELIYVDDRSEDNSFKILKEIEEEFKAKGIKFILTKNKLPQGPSAARNFGAKQSIADIFCFVDSDCIPENDYIEKIKQTFKKDYMLDAVIGNIIPTGEDGLIAQYMKTFHLKLPFEHNTEIKQFEIFKTFGHSANLIIKGSAFNNINGFDYEKFQFFAEDHDICYRLIKNNYNVKFVKEIKVKHYFFNNFNRFKNVCIGYGIGTGNLKTLYDPYFSIQYKDNILKMNIKLPIHIKFNKRIIVFLILLIHFIIFSILSFKKLLLFLILVFLTYIVVQIIKKKDIKKTAIFDYLTICEFIFYLYGQNKFLRTRKQ